MSLLNDMLRDLSQRKPVTGGAEGYDRSLLETSSFTRKQRQPWLPLIAFFVVIFCGVLGIKHFLFSANDNPNPMQQPVAVVQPAKSAEIPIAPVIATPSDSEKTQQNHVESADEMEISADTQHHIDDLLLQAERAINMDRLTAPIEDNAYGYYQKILTLDQNNETAKEGLDRIASRYMLKAQEQLALGNGSQADALMQRARFVSERYVQAHEVVGESANQIYTSSASANEIPALEKTPAESIKSFPVVEAPSVSITPNAAWKDEQLAQHAQQLVQQNKQAEAIELLKNFVAKEQKPALSAALLADLYLQQGNTQAADIILQKATYLAADANAKLRAQILSAEGDDAQAIQVLEKNLVSADANESYRSLLASLYHKTANYQQSITSYQRLLNNFGEKPAYWLGLALAYDGLSQPKNALQAYKRLREFPQLQEQVKKYTDQRIAALSGE
jgi:MSHA biogenesis protein MshN